MNALQIAAVLGMMVTFGKLAYGVVCRTPLLPPMPLLTVRTTTNPFTRRLE